MTEFEVNQVIMPLYIDSAQVYLQLSIGALALSIAFKEKVLGEEGAKPVTVLLLLSWLFFLLTIGSSAFYQYLAVKFLDSVSDHPGSIRYFESLVRGPGRVYGFMLACFFLGAVFLVLSSIRQLFHRKRRNG